MAKKRDSEVVDLTHTQVDVVHNIDFFRSMCLDFHEEIQERRKAYESLMKPTTEEKVNEVLARIGDEGLSLVKACKGIIARSWFNQIVSESKTIQDNYARAKEDREELYFDLIERVAFNRGEDHTAFTGVNVVQRDKLIIDALKWKLARMNHKKYGDKIEVEADVRERVTLVLDLGNVPDGTKLA